MISQAIVFDHFQAIYNLPFHPTKTGLSEFKRKLQELVLEANRSKFAIQFPDLDELIEERAPQNCNHHLDQCRRMEDPYLEACFYLKAAISSTKRYSVTGIVEIYIQ
ncbi:MAG: hypothetical protein ACXAE3_17330 [Candidatus Kariarchaeaceae archaeon]